MADDIVTNIYFSLGKGQSVDDIVTRLRADWFRPSRLVQDEAADEIERLRAVLDAINALHFPLQSMGTRRECAADGDDWPCPTHLLIHPKEARRG